MEFTIKTEPCTKVRFSSERFALEYITHLKKTSTRKNIPQRCYLCTCGAWHLTSQSEALTKLVTEQSMEIARLKNELETYTKSSKVSERIQVKADDRVTQLQKCVENKNKELSALRKTISGLIMEKLSLEKKINLQKE